MQVETRKYEPRPFTLKTVIVALDFVTFTVRLKCYPDREWYANGVFCGCCGDDRFDLTDCLTTDIKQQINKRLGVDVL